MIRERDLRTLAPPAQRGAWKPLCQRGQPAAGKEAVVRTLGSATSQLWVSEQVTYPHLLETANISRYILYNVNIISYWAIP